jgi:serine/threonine protein kinase
MEPGPSAKDELQPATPLKSWRAITPRVPDHELLRRIGEGSYGEVWLARSLVGTLRAVKVVYRDRFKDERPYEREFSGIQKYEPISRSNEGLVDVLQIGRNDAEHYFYYVMELADNAATDDPREPLPVGNPSVESYVPKTLAQQIRLHRRLSVQECITLGLNLNLALGHLHRNGLIHRDVKPSNIIFVNGVPKLADIGLVTEMAEAQSFVGTEGFIPPEGPNSPQADIYALGKVLYEASMAKDRREFPEPYSNLGTDED